MTDFNLEEFFEQFEDCCVPTNTKGVTEFEWSAKGTGFGSFYFFYRDGKLMCDNEIMPKRFIKKMLCNMVDNCTLVDEARKPPVNFTSYSGDQYYIPKENYEVDTWLYNKAVQELNEAAMLYFEEGNTGWILVD
jgi:hypothetical protein